MRPEAHRLMVAVCRLVMDPECDQANFNLEAVCMMSEGAYVLWLGPNQWSSWDIWFRCDGGARVAADR